jgi:hypothetical protein
MSDKVEYILSIKDLASGSLKTVAFSAGNAGNAMDSAKTKTGGLGGALGKLGIAAGLTALAFKGFQFLKESVEDFNTASQAGAQLDATLKSTSYSAGLTRDALDKQSTALSKVTKFDDDAITSMQSLLLTFTDIKGAVFQEATPAILDLAEKMGGDLKGASIQVGKALNDPIKGVTALSKVGVSFTQSQKDTIKTLVNTGKQAEAQRIILAELNKEFGGSSEAAAKAGTGGLTVLANRFGNIQESMGGLIVHGFEKLYPLLSKVMDIIEAAPEFMKKYSTEIETAGVFIGTLAAATGIYALAVNASAIGTGIWTAAQWLLNAALTANPIGLVIAGIAALAAGIYYAWQKSETFRSTLYGLWEVAKVLVSAFITLQKALIFPSPSNIKDAISTLSGLGNSVSNAYSSGKAKGKESFKKSQESPKLSNVSGGQAGAPGGSTTSAKPSKTASMAAASKAVNFNVTIDSLVKTMIIQKDNFKESALDMKSKIAENLISAVNDFQRVAGV